ncbi:MAG TPA: phosphosugar isomerase, partial [Deinococcales bacterium]|nr:phosphosugar isomerase [Deinococcales bacterium]
MTRLNETPAPTGLDLIRGEMARQHADALNSLSQGDLPARIAAAANSTGRLVLLGMGGSHMTNRAAEGLYRAAGLDATALILSDVLQAPLPDRPRVTLIASQSGDSGEVTEYLARKPGQEQRFGLTLNPSGALAKGAPSLLGAGGPEVAYAATRSITLAVALHATILAALGEDPAPLRAVLQTPPDPDLTPALQALSGVTSLIVTARGPLAGLAEVAALGSVELARVPALGMDGG